MFFGPENPDKSCPVCNLHTYNGHSGRLGLCPGPGAFLPGGFRNPNGLRDAMVPKDWIPPEQFKHVGYVEEYSERPKYNLWTPWPWAAQAYLASIGGDDSIIGVRAAAANYAAGGWALDQDSGIGVIGGGLPGGWAVAAQHAAGGGNRGGRGGGRVGLPDGMMARGGRGGGAARSAAGQRAPRPPRSPSPVASIARTQDSGYLVTNERPPGWRF